LAATATYPYPPILAGEDVGDQIAAAAYAGLVED